MEKPILKIPGNSSSRERGWRCRIHYHAVGEEITDQLEIGMWFYPKGVTPTYSVTYVSVGTLNNKPLHIPPHSVTVHQGSFTLPAPAILHNFQPHMHYRGSAFSMEAIYPDGRRELLNHAEPASATIGT